MTPGAVTMFEPQPRAHDIPARMPSPFAHGEPAGLARRAADELQARLRRGDLPDGVDLAVLDQPGGGKMFGVLVCQDANGRVGYLSGFSGMLDGRWLVAGFAPPLFDLAARDTFWPAGEAELGEIDAVRRDLVDGPGAVDLRGFAAAQEARHAADLDAIRARHHAGKVRRGVERTRLLETSSGEAQRLGLHALDQESRGDAAERRRLDAAQREERDAVAARLGDLDSRRAEIDPLRALRSNHYLERILDTYVIASAKGERRSLRSLFAPGAPPGGAGDCAAPKLLGWAYRLGVRPLALAELWWGAPPWTGDRRAGVFYPACRGKCGVVLPFMLDGLPVDEAPGFGGGPVAEDEPRVIFADEWLIVVDKPAGLLSVPGRHARLHDSVLSRLRERFPDATGPLVAHRLDLDTSGLLVAARDPETHRALQRLFARRMVDKRYIAWLDGQVAGDEGTVELALRVDVEDRPRQIHDPIHGDPAVTRWRVLARTATTTRVAFHPLTGRTHQLRVHASHPSGLAAPIVGDRLYGRAGVDQRLMLHAEGLAFTHPRTGERMTFEQPAPF